MITPITKKRAFRGITVASIIIVLFFIYYWFHRSPHLEGYPRSVQDEATQNFVNRLRSRLIHDVSRELSHVKQVSILYLDSTNFNCGDQALGVSTLMLMSHLGIQIPVIHSWGQDIYHAINQIKESMPPSQDNAIVIAPGGNLGDIWGFQEDHMLIVDRFPNYKIVFLPQSIKIQSDENRQRLYDSFSRHQDLTIFTREKPSYKICRKAFPHNKCKLTPDAVFIYGFIGRRRSEVDQALYRSSPVMFLKRFDQESAFEIPLSLTEREDIQINDFVSRENAERVAHLSEAYRGRPFDYCQTVADMGFSMLARGQVVISDRLHGHIMSLLMGVPHVVLSNSYHKIRGMLDTWTGDSPITYKASDVNHAVNTAMMVLCRNGEEQFCT
eukprot:gb/GECH01009789.1/.p1 GENE.gb/GECH01009789.1/~~gb/GECH01009789.1/.p1  ORF type:complete len:384 (+),score=60.86 gb/GECH01009789.1/:1-1152(+)